MSAIPFSRLSRRAQRNREDRQQTHENSRKQNHKDHRKPGRKIVNDSDKLKLQSRDGNRGRQNSKHRASQKHPGNRLPAPGRRTGREGGEAHRVENRTDKHHEAGEEKAFDQMPRRIVRAVSDTEHGASGKDQARRRERRAENGGRDQQRAQRRNIRRVYDRRLIQVSVQGNKRVSDLPSLS